MLGVVAFSMSMLGTFLVRSGILTSVHAFAVDPERGVFILGLLGIATGGALILYAVRAGKIASTTSFDALSREGGLVMNNLLLCIATATVFIGTFYPLLIDALTSEKLTVGPPYFNVVFSAVMLPLIAILGIGQFSRWKSDSLKRLMNNLKYAFVAAMAGAIAAVIMLGGQKTIAAGVGIVGILFGANFDIEIGDQFADRAAIGGLIVDYRAHLTKIRADLSAQIRFP